MITQGSNRPLVIGLPLSVTDAEEIHVLLYGSTGEIKHWVNDSDTTDIEVSTDGNCLLCAMTQEDTAGFPAGRAHCVVKWLDDDGIVHQTKAMPISIKAFADRHIMGDDDAVTTTDIYYEGSLEECQGILTPESIRTAIVIKAEGGGSSGTVTWSAVLNKPSTFPPSTHSHAWADISGKPTSFSPATHTHTQSDVSGLSDALAGKAAINHTHTIDNVSGLQTALDGKQAAGSYAAASHTHSYNSLTDKPTIPAAYDDTQIKQDITALQTGKANTSHSHTTADLTDWIPMSTAVKNALTTGDAWTGAEKTSARQKLGFVQLTQEEYNLLVTPDENTIYIIIGDGT